MHKLLLVLFLLPCTLTFAQKKSKKIQDPFARLDTAFQRVLKERKAVGFAVAVVKNNEVIFSKGYGYRDLENKLPVTTNTLFAIGSCTKAFTSALLGIENNNGNIEYDKPARLYLPDLFFYNDELNNQVTIRDMMTHRTGLPRHDYSWYLFRSSSRDSLLRRIKYMEPSAPLRQTWQYNNFMFLVQGMIAEKLTGKSWEENVQEKIFTPLGMKQSNFSVNDLAKSNDASKGYYVYKDSIIKKMDYYNIDAMGPAGSINSNVNEMANWVITWINGGKFKGKEILPASYISQASSSQMVIRGGLPDKDNPDIHFGNYGFGWMTSSYRGHYRVEHGGNIDGFSASTSYYPSDSIGIIVLTNQNGSSVTSIVRNMISDRLFNLKPIDWLGNINRAEAEAKAIAKETQKGVGSNRKKGTKPSFELNAYEGLYEHPGYGTMEIVAKNDSLFAYSPIDTSWLRHYHYDIFEPFTVDKKEGIDTSNPGQLYIQFYMNTAAEVVKLTLPLQPGLKEDLSFNKKPKAKSITKKELEKYVGEYELSPGAKAKFYIKGDSTLYAFVEGQPEYELTPTEKHKFVFKSLQGFSVLFEENDQGEIIAVSFIQPNGTFKAKKLKQ